MNLENNFKLKLLRDDSIYLEMKNVDKKTLKNFDFSKFNQKLIDNYTQLFWNFLE